MGGVATGCIDIDSRGVWGYGSMFNGWSKFLYFNARIPRMEPNIQPIFGLSVGDQTWALVPLKFISGEKVGWCTEPHNPGVWTKDPQPYVRQLQTLKLEGVKSVQDVLYWGHFPVAEMNFITDAPVGVSARIWSPFFPGKAVESNTPGAVFEVTLRNTSSTEQTGAIAFNFPGPNNREARSGEFTRRNVDGDFRGVIVSSRAGVSYALGTIGESSTRFGAGLGDDPKFWAMLGQKLPTPDYRSDQGTPYHQTGSTSAATDFQLKPGEERIVRFVLAWYAPVWEGAEKKHPGAQPKTTWLTPEWMGETNYFTHMYAARYRSAEDVARRITAEHKDMLRRILSWQNVIYSSNLPTWLHDALINNLSLITENGYWAQAQRPLGDWAFPEGVFALNESSRGCPHLGNIPSDWYGSLPLVYFFPDLFNLEMRAFRQYQADDGEIPFAIGKIHGLPDCVTPEYYWQKSLNGMCYVDMVDRLWQRTGDSKVLADYYDSVRRATIYTMGLSTKSGGPIRMPDDGGMEWFEHGEWAGMATHMGGLRLAMIAMARRMGEAAGDEAFVKECDGWLEEGQTAMEQKMWTDAEGGYYLNFWDPENNHKSDDIMAYQLDGEWVAKFHGLRGVFRHDRVKRALATIREKNVTLTPDIGAANFCRPDGSPLQKKDTGKHETIADFTASDVAHYGSYTMFTAEVVILGMTYIQAGEKQFGIDLVRKHWQNLFCVQRHPWDYPNMIRGDNGARLFGTDYGQAMMLWALPAAIDGQPLDEFTADGGLISRIIQAAK